VHPDFRNNRLSVSHPLRGGKNGRPDAGEDAVMNELTPCPFCGAELRAARKLIDVLLSGPEWVAGNDENAYCPFCDGGEPGPAPRRKFYSDDEQDVYEYDLERWKERGHKSDCLRQAALAEWKKARTR